jgi:putative PEP-CTERM system histidine kinase
VISFDVVGYGLLAALYLVLGALLLTAWRGKRIGGYLIAACLVSVAWAGLLALQAGRFTVHPVLLFTVEVLRSGAWIAFLAHLVLQIGGSRAVRYLAQAVWIGVLAAGMAVWLDYVYFGGAGDIGSVLFPGGLAAALTGLILIEQLYRNTPSETRWSLKWLVLGLGGMFAYELFLYSQAVLFNAIDPVTWAARGPVNLLFVPLVALAARRNPDWRLRIFVSRQVVFYTSTLTAVGLYLILMSAGGYLIARYGGSWGALARVVFFVGAGIVLLTLLFSSSLRAKVKVFLSKHFFQNKYDYREEWLKLIATLAKFEDSSTRQVVVEALANIVESPAGFLWTLDDTGRSYRLAASYRAEDAVPDIPADSPLLRFVREHKWIIDLSEYEREPDVYGDLEIPGWLFNMRLAWLIVPLTYGGQILGLVLLHKAPGPPKLNYEDRDLLKTVGNHIAVHLAQEKSDGLLAEAKQFEAYNRLTAFLMHDLNNLIAQQSLIVKNAERHKRNPEFVDDAIATIANSVERMNKVMAQLKRGEADHGTKRVTLKFIASAAIDRCAGILPEPVLEQLNGDVELVVNSDQFTTILVHLIRNAQQATPESGTVRVQFDEHDGMAIVRIIDDGAGMSPEFVRNRLFRPFDSTKGAEGMGIGAYQAREFARKLGGDLVAESELGRGSIFTLTCRTNGSRA